jgi:cis-3-alkyl-4-acyloxetan-2-one decarboxylase
MKFLSIDNVKLAYIQEGNPNAETIVLLHGYMGSHLTWRHQIKLLSSKYHVFALDWFGWGESSHSTNLKYDYLTELDRLKRVIDKLEIKSFNLFGHDYGGFLALGFAQNFPQKVKRLALLNTRAHSTFNYQWFTIFGLISLFSKIPGTNWLWKYLPLATIHKMTIARELTLGFIDEQVLNNYTGWMENPSEKLFLKHFFSDYSIFIRTELASKLNKIACPTAIIWGAKDIFLSSQIAKTLASAIPSAELTLLEKTGHFVTEESPDLVQQALQILLTRKCY